MARVSGGTLPKLGPGLGSTSPHSNRALPEPPWVSDGPLMRTLRTPLSGSRPRERRGHGTQARGAHLPPPRGSSRATGGPGAVRGRRR